MLGVFNKAFFLTDEQYVAEIANGGSISSRPRAGTRVIGCPGCREGAGATDRRTGAAAGTRFVVAQNLYLTGGAGRRSGSSTPNTHAQNSQSRREVEGGACSRSRWRSSRSRHRRSQVVGSVGEDANLTYISGQAVAPVFHGWLANPDGTFDLYFSYINRNWQEEVDIPVGPNNNISPAPFGPDAGQPTHFFPRINRWQFTVRVPKDFGTKRSSGR